MITELITLNQKSKRTVMTDITTQLPFTMLTTSWIYMLLTAKLLTILVQGT